MGNQKNLNRQMQPGDKNSNCQISKQQQKQKQQQATKLSNAKSPKSLHSKQFNYYDNQLNTPCRQIAQLELKQKIKQSKLLSSKSLSQLMPRSLFFKKNNKPVQGQTNDSEGAGNNWLKTTKSFPNGAFSGLHSNCVMVSNGEVSNVEDIMMRNNTPTLPNRLGSASLIGLPRQSSSIVSFANNHQGDSTLTQPSLSPIAAEESDRYHDEAFGMTLTTSDDIHSSASPVQQFGQDEVQQQAKDGQDGGEGAGNKKADQNGNKYKPLKSTKLVLRDVKNSIGIVSFADKQ